MDAKAAAAAVLAKQDADLAELQSELAGVEKQAANDVKAQHVIERNAGEPPQPTSFQSPSDQPLGANKYPQREGKSSAQFW